MWFGLEDFGHLWHGGLEQEVPHRKGGGVDGRENHHGFAGIFPWRVPGEVEGDVHPGLVPHWEGLQLA